MVDKCIKMIKDGAKPEDVFNDCSDFSEGYARVELNNRYNFIDENGNILSNQWFDDCLSFSEGCAAVKLNGKWNYIDKKGNLYNEDKIPIQEGIKSRIDRLIKEEIINELIKQEVDNFRPLHRKGSLNMVFD